MGSRIVITPNEFSPSGTTSPRLKLVFNFGGVAGADKLVDSRARLVIYDRDLYFATPLGKQEGWAPFMKDGQKIPMNLGAGPDALDPPFGDGTGVLAKVEGVIRRTLDKKHWCFKPTNTATNTGETALSLIVESFDDLGNFAPLCTVSYPKEDLAGPLMRYLLFRLVNLGASFGAPESGDVIACNINPTHNAGAVGPTLSGGAVTFHVAAEDTTQQSQIGGDGGAKPVAEPKAVARAIVPDLTGLYEAYPFDETGKETTSFDYDPPLMVHINQAGNALVGWFSPCATNLGAKPSAPPAVVPTASGCFYSFAKGGPNGRHCEWFLQKGEPTRNSTDPDLQPPDLKSMTLKVEDGPTDDVAIRITLTFDDVDASGAIRSGTLRLRRTGVSTRIPFFFLRPYLNDIDQKLDPQQVEFAREVVQDQIEVLPMTWWCRLSRRVSTDLLPLIQQWVDAGGFAGGQDSKRGNARDAVSKFLLSLIPPPLKGKESPARDRYLGGRVRALLQAIDVRVDNGETHPALEWLRLMVEDAITDVLKRHPELSSSDVFNGSNNYIEGGFRHLQIGPSGEFVYTLKFLSIGGATPALIYVGAYGFLMTVVKERITKVGGVEERTPVEDAGWTFSNHVEFAGVILQAGAGAGFDLKKMKGTAKGLSDVPGEVEFRTCIDIGSVDDFHGASFSVNALKIGAGGAMYAKGALVNSAFVQFSLANGVVLDTVVDSSMTFKVDFDMEKVKSSVLSKQPRTAEDVDELTKGLVIPEATLIQYVWSGGKIFLQSRMTGATPAMDPVFVTQRMSARTSRTVLFDLDSASLTETNRGWLEAQLAVDRSLFEARGGSGLSEGYASPEATEDHNQKLTEMRAEAVVLAVKDAFGDVSVIPITYKGLGEEPARKAGLVNPPDPPRTPWDLPPEQRKRMKVEQQQQWPGWRRVDLTVDGLLVLRVMGRGARS